jgi:hypothetical protein
MKPLMAKTILVCPQCGSADIFYENAMITGIVYHCKKCDYIGPVIFERDLTEEELEAMKPTEGGKGRSR